MPIDLLPPPPPFVATAAQQEATLGHPDTWKICKLFASLSINHVTTPYGLDTDLIRTSYVSIQDLSTLPHLRCKRAALSTDLLEEIGYPDVRKSLRACLKSPLIALKCSLLMPAWCKSRRSYMKVVTEAIPLDTCI